MADDDRDQARPSLEPPQLFGRRKQQKKATPPAEPATGPVTGPTEQPVPDSIDEAVDETAGATAEEPVALPVADPEVVAELEDEAAPGAGTPSEAPRRPRVRRPRRGRHDAAPVVDVAVAPGVPDATEQRGETDEHVTDEQVADQRAPDDRGRQEEVVAAPTLEEPTSPPEEAAPAVTAELSETTSDPGTPPTAQPEASDVAAPATAVPQAQGEPDQPTELADADDADDADESEQETLAVPPTATTEPQPDSDPEPGPEPVGFVDSGTDVAGDPVDAAGPAAARHGDDTGDEPEPERESALVAVRAGFNAFLDRAADLSSRILDGRNAAMVSGFLVGLLLIGLTRGGAATCEAVRGTSACGVPLGLTLLVLIVAVAMVVGWLLLRFFYLDEAGSMSVLSVGLLAVITLLFLLDLLDNVVVIVLIPFGSALCFLVGWWLTTSFTEPDVIADQRRERERRSTV